MLEDEDSGDEDPDVEPIVSEDEVVVLEASDREDEIDDSDPSAPASVADSPAPSFNFVLNGPVDDLPDDYKVKSTATVQGRFDHPRECFDACFPQGLFLLMVNETNRQGRKLQKQRMEKWVADKKNTHQPQPWKPTTMNEIRTLHGLFLGISIYGFTNLKCY